MKTPFPLTGHMTDNKESHEEKAAAAAEILKYYERFLFIVSPGDIKLEAAEKRSCVSTPPKLSNREM